MKICLAASSGGHLTQLVRVSDACEGKSYFFVVPYSSSMDHLHGKAKIYFVTKANRNHPVLLLSMLVQCFKIMYTERPDVVISTGAAVGCILCILAKLARKKIIWIDTISHVNRLTLSGRIIRPIADLFLVQWPDLTKRYKRTKYVGALA
jgi:UDP-N-acetylglucosamine:LPS N-acetylglucosamine transferase